MTREEATEAAMQYAFLVGELRGDIQTALISLDYPDTTEVARVLGVALTRQIPAKSSPANPLARTPAPTNKELLCEPREVTE